MSRYQNTLDYMYKQLPMFQRKGAAAYKDNLDNTLLLDKWYNHPHTKFKSIHIAGTNGKGSSSHMLASILQNAGYKVGLYTSPHLRDFRERIRINGEMISEEAVVSFIDQFKERREQEPIEPSFFELTVAMAFDFFAKEEVDIAVIETGLGGRLDSTNIIKPILSIITNIGLDHTNLLGTTLPEIAQEKAGIIKKQTTLIVGEIQEETQPIFETKVEELDAPIFYSEEVYQIFHPPIRTEKGQILQVEKRGEMKFPDLLLDLQGKYQIRNVKSVLLACEELEWHGIIIEENHIREGLKSVVQTTGLLGRWQTLQEKPKIICDTGHNVAGVDQIMEQLEETPYNKLHIVLGMVNDKDIKAILAMFPEEATYYYCKANIPRALDSEELQKQGKEFNLIGDTYSTVIEALEAAKKEAQPNDLIFVGGSTFTVAEVV